MKIIQIVTQREAGGAQQQALSAADNLRARGYSIETWFLYAKREALRGAEGTRNLRAKPLGGGLRGALNAVRILAKLYIGLKREKPDAVFTYSHWSNVLGAPIARLAGVKTVFAHQTGLPSRVPGLARWLDSLWGTLGVYTYSIANSVTTRSQFGRHPWPYKRRLRLIELGITLPKGGRNRLDARAHYKIPAKVPLLVHVGRLALSKNHAALIKAMTGLDGVHVAFIGDGELKAELEALAARNNLTERVHWLGELPRAEMSDVLRAADAFVFPSLWESFGLAPVEAAAAGLPLAVADVPTLREVMQLNDGTPAAQFFNPQNPAALAACLKQLLEDAPLRARLEAASARLAEKYSMSRMTDTTENLLRETFRK